MVISLSSETMNIMLDAVAGTMSGGSIELLSDSGNLLAVLKLSNPAAGAAVDGELVLNKIAEEDAALAQGVARSARIVGAGGDEIFSCDVGGMDSNAVIRLNPQLISAGAPVRIDEFRLVMP